MSVGDKITIAFVTSNPFKIEENSVFVECCQLADGSPVKDLFSFEIHRLRLQEILDVDLNVIAADEAQKAYSALRIPCIVEHAGILFQDHAGASYPGGLTKPMWNTLGPKFVEEMCSAGRKAIARAVVAYCDGMSVRTFVGETPGELAPAPRGARNYYWDTIFVPSDPSGKASGLTYAEIAENASLGLPYKVAQLSQSTAAMKEFLAYRLKAGTPLLWR